MDNNFIIGLMSGTSLDGVDIACCSFQKTIDNWEYNIVAADTIPYDKSWIDRLKKAHKLHGHALLKLNQEYGFFLGNVVAEFIKEHSLKVSLIGSHGHTVFHQPEQKLTFQLGHGKALALSCGIDTVADFRSDDVLKGGQGAPFAPVGDYYLFDDYRFRINLGGFSNISYEKDGKVIAYDICPVNYVLNAEARKEGLDFDNDGLLARKGKVDTQFLHTLNSMDYYNRKAPKSLGREWIETELKPLAGQFKNDPKDNLATFLAHISNQIACSINEFPAPEKVLITGGGAWNTFLIEQLQQKTHHKIIVPDAFTVNYKEALIFAFMAHLRKNKKENVFASVTGASSNSSAGTIYSVK
ncbi:MAG: anhydro-N-acetylmuramic acid kinase [Bacteroidales bacterium]